jgi:hypothetical protein
VISARQATLRELSTVYGVADLYRLVEIIRVDTFNQRLANKWASREET